MRFLTGITHCSRIDIDSESISDDSVLKNSLTIQSLTSSRDVSPFKPSRNSWNTASTENVISPLPSPRPPIILNSTQQTSTDSQNQCTINIEGNNNMSNNQNIRSKLSTEL